MQSLLNQIGDFICEEEDLTDELHDQPSTKFLYDKKERSSFNKDLVDSGTPEPLFRVPA